MPSVTRREFSARLSTAVAFGLASVPTLADDAPSERVSDSREETEPRAEAAPQATPRPDAPLTMEDLELEVLLDIYPGKHLTPEMREGIREGLAHNRRIADQLRSVAIPSAVEPAFVFRAR